MMQIRFSHAVDCVHNPSVESPWNQWTKSMESMDKVHGQSPAGVLERKQWTISSESMENVHGFCPWNPWILSMEAMDFVQGDSGQCPWKLSMDNVHGKKSMDIVHGIHGNNPWTFQQ